MATSPDATPYVDLRPYDRDAQDLFDAAIANLQSYLPEWEPREGHTEVLLLESLALPVEEAIFALNRLPGAVVEVLLRLYGVARDLGTPPTGLLEFTVVDTNGHTVPAGTRVALTVASEEDPIVFSTDAPLAVAPGALTGTVAATGDRNTTAANGTAAGSTVELLDSVSSVERVDLAGEVTGGVDPEDDAAWFTRGAQRFARLAETLVLPRHFTSAAMERPEVTRAFTVDNYQPGVGAAAGHVTVAVYGDGAVLSAAQKAAIETDFDAQAQANLAVHVTDPTITDVTVTAEVVGTLGYTVAQVQANATAALDLFLSPEQWPWTGTVYRNEIIALLDRVEGVERVTSVSVPAADLALSGVAPLARLAAANITVTGL